MTTTNLLKYAISALCGFAIVFSFSPHEMYPLAILIPILLLFIFEKSKPITCLLYGIIFGSCMFFFGLFWIHTSIYKFASFSKTTALLITLILSVIMSLCYGMGFYLFKKISIKYPFVKPICIFPGIWTLTELVRSTCFSFPFLVIGYSQTNSILKAYAPMFGVYGISFLIILISTTFFTILKSTSKSEKIISVIIISVVIIGAILLKNTNWTKLNKKIKIAMVQENIPNINKWLPENEANTINIMQQAIKKNIKSQIIIFPEGALAVFDMQKLNNVYALLKKNNSYAVFGTMTLDNNKIYNSLLLMGENIQIYNKKHLVPFGEYIPFPKLFNFFAKRTFIQMSDISSGEKKQKPLMIHSKQLISLICFEIAYPFDVASQVGKDSFIVLISDNSWFGTGNSNAAYQQIQMAQMRAIETGRYVLCCSNTGITAIINENGQIIKAIDTDTFYTLNATISTRSGATPFVKYKYLSLILLLITPLIISLL